jgi:malate dehydrogenase
LAEALDVSVNDIQPTVLGGHGDTMVPIARYTTVAGVPDHGTFETRPASGHSSTHAGRRGRDRETLKTGSAYYAPSASVAAMVESILKDKKRILPCAAYLEGRIRRARSVLGRAG